MPATAAAAPSWLDTWPQVWPHARREWTVRAADDTWAVLDPASGAARRVDPSADRKLPGIAVVGARSDARLLGYRAGRRASFAVGDGFAKVVRPGRLAGIDEVHRLIADKAAQAGCGGPALDVPTVVSTDPLGVVVVSPVAGPDLHSVLVERSSSAERRTSAVLTAVTVVHLLASLAPDGLERAPEPDLRAAQSMVERGDPTFAERTAAVLAELPDEQPTGEGDLVVSHGDLHDKNLFLGGPQGGVIDLDGVGLGPAERDVANLAVHLMLRGLQTGAPAEGDRLARLLVERVAAIRTLRDTTLDAATRRTWFRLACLYRFRASGRHLGDALLERSAITTAW